MYLGFSQIIALCVVLSELCGFGVHGHIQSAEIRIFSMIGPYLFESQINY